jgi:hypothetical protein
MWQRVVENWNMLSKQQKFSVFVLGFCGALALGFSLYRVQASIVEPFLVDKAELLKTKKIIGETPEEATAREKRTDTDGDGLSDWDETNTFHTNANLKDTCGDGVTDNVRVITGKNLNCIYGQSSGAPPSASDVTAPALPNADALNSQFPAAQLPGASSTTTPASAVAVPSYIPRDPAAIRAALKGTVDQTKLDATSDETLLQLYDQAVQAQTQQNPQSQTSSTQ